MTNPISNTNHREAQKCIVPDCACNQNGNGLGLCSQHYEDVLWMKHEGQISDPPYDEDTREVIVTALAERGFNTDCAHAFDQTISVEVYAPGADLHAAPSYIVPAWKRNGRTR